MNPTDPMTPVRALIEAAGKATPELDAETLAALNQITNHEKDPNFDMSTLIGVLDKILSASAKYVKVAKAARNATASISQLLS